jgi:hypothetical protein
MAKFATYSNIDVAIVMSITVTILFAVYGVVNVTSYSSMMQFEAKAQNQLTKLTSSVSSSSQSSADTKNLTQQ